MRRRKFSLTIQISRCSLEVTNHLEIFHQLIIFVHYIILSVNGAHDDHCDFICYDLYFYFQDLLFIYCVHAKLLAALLERALSAKQTNLSGMGLSWYARYFPHGDATLMGRLHLKTWLSTFNKKYSFQCETINVMHVELDSLNVTFYFHFNP